MNQALMDMLRRKFAAEIATGATGELEGEPPVEPPPMEEDETVGPTTPRMVAMPATTPGPDADMELLRMGLDRQAAAGDSANKLALLGNVGELGKRAGRLIAGLPAKDAPLAKINAGPANMDPMVAQYMAEKANQRKMKMDAERAAMLNYLAGAQVADLAGKPGREAAKASAEAARREQERNNKLADEESRRRFQAGENEKDRASREKAAAMTAGAKEQTRLDEDVKDYAKAIPEGAPQFLQQARTIDAILVRHGSDIPGVGGGANWLPDIMLSDDGVELRKNVQQMMLAYQKLVTGTGGSAEELKKIADAGADLKSDRTFLKGYESLKKNYMAYLRKVQGGFRPEVVKTFEQRVPEMKVAPAAGNVDLAAPRAQPSPGPGYVHGVDKNGKPGWWNSQKKDWKPD